MKKCEPTPGCSSWGSLIPDTPPEISSVDSLQLETTTLGIISRAEQRIAELGEMEGRSLENHSSILRQLEEYRCFVFHQQSLVTPICRLPSELLSEVFVTVADDFKNPSDLPWDLGKVCRRWRDVVETTPHLWNRLPRISARSFNLSLIQKYFTLARGLPLSIDVYIGRACVESSPFLEPLISHSDRIGELKVACWGLNTLRLLSGIHSRLHNLCTLTLKTSNRGDTATAIFSIAPQLRTVCFISKFRLYGIHFSMLDLPWGQLKTVTIHLSDLDYAWMLFSQAAHMEVCAFVEIVNIGIPRGTIRHRHLKELSLEGWRNDSFPTALSDILVLPSLISLLVKFEKLTINPIISLMTRSECSLTKLVLNGPIIEGSLIMLLEETASLIHLEVRTLLPADIKGLIIDKKNGKEPITPRLRVVHITNSDDITDPSSINALIRSRVDPEIPRLNPIQNMHFLFKDSPRVNQIYGQLRGFPWMARYNGVEHGWVVMWAKGLRDLIARLPSKNEDISVLNHTLGQMECWETIKQPFLATSEIYESLVYISSEVDGNHLGLPNPQWSQLQERIRLLLSSWGPVREECGKFPQSNWKHKMPADSLDPSFSSISYFASGK